MWNKIKYGYTAVILFFVNMGFWMAAKVMRHAVIVRGLDPDFEGIFIEQEKEEFNFEDLPDVQRMRWLTEKMQTDGQVGLIVTRRHKKNLQKQNILEEQKILALRDWIKDMKVAQAFISPPFKSDVNDNIKDFGNLFNHQSDLIETLKDEDYQLVIPPPLLNQETTKTPKKKTKKASKTTGKK